VTWMGMGISGGGRLRKILLSELGGNVKFSMRRGLMPASPLPREGAPAPQVVKERKQEEHVLKQKT
jgi:hypothetical protein